MPETTIVLKSEPGIKRDGTKFDGNFYTDGQWVRWQRGLPRKIGGYKSIQRTITEVSRGFTNFTQQLNTYCHTGGAALLERFTVDGSGNSSVIDNRTPASLVADSNNQWMFDYQYDSSSKKNYILAHVTPSMDCACNSGGGQIFFGEVTGTGLLAPITLPADTNCTGGIVSLHPYLFYYGSDGIVGWSAAGKPTDLTVAGGGGIARPWGQKIIKGMPLRAGSGSAPAGIFWAWDAVIRATFTGGATVFQFDTIASDTSIISAGSVVDYDGVFFWAGVDRFLMFNGVVREVPNSLNLNYFYDGLNKSRRSKVFAFKAPRYGEIWWCYPRGTATECTHAVIFNVRENTWYDTQLPNSGRGAGQFSNAFAAPILTGVDGPTNEFRAWLHESGANEIDGSRLAPIRSYFETADLSNLVQGQNQYVRITAIEPDFIQSGDMTVQVTGRANARAQEVYGTQFTFPDVATEAYEQMVMLKEQRRELRVRFESNAVNGDYQMGQIIGHISTGDKTMVT